MSPMASSRWYIDLLNLNLNNHSLATARARIQAYIETFEPDGTRITEELDFSFRA
jgi:hypothetical protein